MCSTIQQLIDVCNYLSQNKNLAVRDIGKSGMRVSLLVSGSLNSQPGFLFIGYQGPGRPSCPPVGWWVRPVQFQPVAGDNVLHHVPRRPGEESRSLPLPPGRVALGDRGGGQQPADRQWYSQRLTELGSSIFMSANSNGGRGENISGNFLLCL